MNDELIRNLIDSAAEYAQAYSSDNSNDMKVNIPTNPYDALDLLKKEIAEFEESGNILEIGDIMNRFALLIDSLRPVDIATLRVAHGHKLTVMYDDRKEVDKLFASYNL